MGWVVVPLHNLRVGVVPAHRPAAELHRQTRPCRGSGDGFGAKVLAGRIEHTVAKRITRSFARDPYLVPNLTRRRRWVPVRHNTLCSELRET